MIEFLKKNPLFYIVFAGFLWSLDSIFRLPLAKQLSNESVVFFENFIGLLVILPFIFIKHRKAVLEVNKKDFIKLAFLGIFGSVLANIFLTKSLGPLGPGFFSFLQAFQPLFVVWLATTFLKEDFDGLYPLWGMWVIGSSVLLNITDFELGSFYKLLDYPLETLLALIAMMIWGSCTVIGKNLLKSYSPSVVVFWRWAFATVTLGVHMTILGHEIQWGQLADFSVLWRVLCISTVMGCFAMVVYYNGLKRFPASLTAFIELSYPAFTMLVGSAYLYHKIEILQLIGLVSLTGAIFFMVKGSTIFEKKKTRS